MGQFAQGIDGVSGSSTRDLARIDHRAGHARKGQSSHGQSVRCITESMGFVPGLPGRQHPHLVQLQLIDRRLDQRHVGQMRRIERAAKYADALGCTHTQSRGTK